MQNAKATFNHFNVNVVDLEKSIDFYKKALGLEKIGGIDAPDGSFKLELTWLRDKIGAYNLGDNESHLCMSVDGDYAKWREFHKQMGCVCFENFEMNLYFIEDPDGYWIEIIPQK